MPESRTITAPPFTPSSPPASRVHSGPLPRPRLRLNRRGATAALLWLVLLAAPLPLEQVAGPARAGQIETASGRPEVTILHADYRSLDADLTNLMLDRGYTIKHQGMKRLQFDKPMNGFLDQLAYGDGKPTAPVSRITYDLVPGEMRAADDGSEEPAKKRQSHHRAAEKAIRVVADVQIVSGAGRRGQIFHDVNDGRDAQIIQSMLEGLKSRYDGLPAQAPGTGSQGK